MFWAFDWRVTYTGTEKPLKASTLTLRPTSMAMKLNCFDGGFRTVSVRCSTFLNEPPGKRVMLPAYTLPSERGKPSRPPTTATRRSASQSAAATAHVVVRTSKLKSPRCSAQPQHAFSHALRSVHATSGAVSISLNGCGSFGFVLYCVFEMCCFLPCVLSTL